MFKKRYYKLFIYCPYHDRNMSKSDSFFIRQTINAGDTNTFNQVEIDLGFVVDALGKSVCRIHNIAVLISDSTGVGLQVAANSAAVAQFQLTTQSQGAMILPDNRSIVSSGSLYAVNDLSSEDFPAVYDKLDNLPQQWTNGYLVAVEQLYLGAQASTAWDSDVYITIVMECTAETMTQAAAMALSLSQQ